MIPKLDISERNDDCIQVRNASHVYGNECLQEIPLKVHTDHRGWFPIEFMGDLFQGYQSEHWYQGIYSSTTAVNPVNSIINREDWPEEKTPFTQMNLLNREEKQLRELIFRLRTTLSIPYRESLANRLNTLFHDSKEEDPSSIGITIGSLRCFYNFIKLNIDLTCPTITLTPETNIYATWREKINHLTSVHFLPNGETRFVIFKPNTRHPEKTVRIYGTTTFDNLMETLEPYGVKDWIAL